MSTRSSIEPASLYSQLEDAEKAVRRKRWKILQFRETGFPKLLDFSFIIGYYT